MSLKLLVPVALLLGSALGCANDPAPKAPSSSSATRSCVSLEDCAQAVAEDPGDPRLRVLWGRMLAEKGKAAAAAREFRAAIRLTTDPTSPVVEAADGLVRLGDASGCVAELDVQLASSAKLPKLRARLLEARARCEDAATKATY